MTTYDSKGDEVESVVADSDKTVQDPNSDDPRFKREVFAGQTVPPDLVDAYEGKAQKGPARDKAKKGPETNK